MPCTFLAVDDPASQHHMIFLKLFNHPGLEARVQNVMHSSARQYSSSPKDLPDCCIDGKQDDGKDASDIGDDEELVVQVVQLRVVWHVRCIWRRIWGIVVHG